MSGVQEWIYLLGEGAGARALKFFLLLLAVVALAVIYDLRAYKCFSQPEAMDQAQLARNLAAGKDYTTQFIRPFGLYLLQNQVNKRVDEALRTLPPERKNWTSEQQAKMAAISQPGQLTGPHPDITNPPAYPYLLATFMHLVPFHYEIKGTGRFLQYQPELLIAILNQTLFFLVVWMTFCLARRLFDTGVAWLSAVALMVTELFWRFSISGLSTMLLLVFFLGIVWCLVWLDQGAEEFWGLGKMLGLAALCGALLGLGTLTRYAFAWMTMPVLIFMGAFLGGRRMFLYLVTLMMFAAVVAPWLARNYQLSGALFGTASYVVHEGTAHFPATQLGRSLDPSFTHVDTYDIPAKLMTSLRTILANDLPKLGGSWVSAFFLVGLLVPFKSQSLMRLRTFILIGLGLFAGVQALVRTPLSAETEVSSENLLVLFAPLIFMFGVGLFYTVLDQARAAVWEARPLFLGGFILMAGAPLLTALLPPRTHPLAYPPYSPPLIQAVSRWMHPNEFMMSDIPWAVAWYGNRTCVWLPLNSQAEFTALHRQRPIQALYLTPQTLDNRFLSQWLQGENQGWGGFIAECLLRREVPTGFPLADAYLDLFPEQLFLTDRRRWNEPPKEW
jgi:4-amino-4-deoxy-L-arabinose transferase-like glycosyltransferase